MYIIAGPNGSGKTTFAKEFLPHYAHCDNFINADLIASGLSPFSPTNARIKAGRLLLEQMNQFVSSNKDFAIESTLAGKTYFSLIEKIKNQKNYSIHIFFLWIPDVKLAYTRIKQRVRGGGHDVPQEDVQRRFGRSVKNFFNLYSLLCDSWILFDNSGQQPMVVAEYSKKNLITQDLKLFKHITKGLTHD